MIYTRRKQNAQEKAHLKERDIIRFQLWFKQETADAKQSFLSYDFLLYFKSSSFNSFSCEKSYTQVLIDNITIKLKNEYGLTSTNNFNTTFLTWICARADA